MGSLKSSLIKIFIKLKEHRYGKKLRYLFFNNSSDTLLIVFSGFTAGNERRYNYVKSFGELKCDKLFVLDPYGYRDSYHLFENGSSYPQNETESLLLRYVKLGGYKRVITAGTSKGGSCALFYGLKIGANEIFAGAQQYRLGTYLTIDKHKEIFFGMMGESAGEKERVLLDSIYKEQLENCAGRETVINLLYSTAEPTYLEETVFLLEDLKKYHYQVKEQIVDFSTHAEVGIFFPKFVLYNI